MEHLIPESLFVGQPQWALLLMTAFAIAVLGKGADWLVEGASGIAYHIGISKVIVGATLVSLGTTSPEAAVSVMAAWAGEPGLALGNAIGSVIADTGLIFGIGCLMVTLPIDRFVVARQGWVQFGSASLLTVIVYGLFLIDGDAAVVGRWVGVVFVGLLVVYLYVSVRWSRQHRFGEPFQIDDAAVVEQLSHESYWKLIPMLVAGLALVLLASRALIQSVTELAEVHWHVPNVVIAATLVALGTSLPEMVIGVASILKGHREILVGNIIGADILNVLFVVGAASLAAPLPIVEAEARVPRIMLLVHLPAMMLILVLFRMFIFAGSRDGQFRRWHGIPLIAIYVLYTILQYVIS